MEIPTCAPIGHRVMSRRSHQQPVAHRFSAVDVEIDVPALVDLRSDRAAGGAGLVGTDHLQLLGADKQIDRRRWPDAAQRARRHLDARGAHGDDGMGSVEAIKPSAQHIGVADKGCDEAVAGPAIDFFGSTELANAPFRHDREPIGQAQGLALVMGDEESS